MALEVLNKVSEALIPALCASVLHEGLMEIIPFQHVGVYKLYRKGFQAPGRSPAHEGIDAKTAAASCPILSIQGEHVRTAKLSTAKGLYHSKMLFGAHPVATIWSCVSWDMFLRAAATLTIASKHL